MSGENLYKMLLVELFHRVGRSDITEYDQALEYAQEHGDEWYTTYTWTDEQERDYRAWALKILKAHGVLRPEFEIDAFLLCYGWSRTKVNP